MNEHSKLGLSTRELEIAMNSELILTKHHIIHVVNNLFNEQVGVIRNELQSGKVKLTNEVLKNAPRIFRGENYNKLPYVILDYPAVFGKENIFALRTMFWWGNFFSITIHLKGTYHKMFSKNISDKIYGETEGMFICVNQDQWEHHFEMSNYIPVNNVTIEHCQNKINSGDFLKLAFKVPLQDWNNMSEHFALVYKRIANLLSD